MLGRSLSCWRSGIGPKGSDIAPRRSDVAGGQYADGSGNMPKEKTACWKFEQSAG